MSKTITQNQIIGEIGETAVRHRFLDMGFQFDVRSRLEAGIDGIAEVMIDGRPLAQMIAVQVKATNLGRYASEDAEGFSYLLRSEDMNYWRPSNLPVIIVLYRKEDESIYWKEVPRGTDIADRRLRFDKNKDVLDRGAVDRLAALTVSNAGFGYYVPPLGDGEEAVVNMLPLTLPEEMFVAPAACDGSQATEVLRESDPSRFDWVIHGGTFWSFHDPRASACRAIVDLDQVEAIDTVTIAGHDDEDEQHRFSWLLRQALAHQFRNDVVWNKKLKYFYFKAIEANTTRTFAYRASKNRAQADVVNVSWSKGDQKRVEFVRHHAFKPRFERLMGTWYLLIDPTYHFTTNGFAHYSKPAGLLAGKKRMDNSASLRGQVIMWHRLLSSDGKAATGLDRLFDDATEDPVLRFGEPPIVQLSTRVPEDVWGAPKKPATPATAQEDFFA